VLFLLSFQAESALTMHVFEQSNALIASNNSQKPVLEMHIFTRPSKEQRNGVVPNYKKSRAEHTVKPALKYQRTEVYFKTGYRHDDLHWSIAAVSGTPNIVSELTWQDIEIATISSGATVHIQDNWLVNFDIVYGHVFDGKNQDSDYYGNNRTLEFSRSNNGADEGDVLDLSAAVGYRWKVPFNQHSPFPQIDLIPQVGLSYYSQNLKMVDGRQTLSDYGFGMPLGRFPNLNTTYDATWFGPWLGLKSQFIFNHDFKLGVSFEYHHAFYDATANWNLRSDFAHPESYIQEAEGYGLVSNIEGQLQLDTNLALNVTLNYQDWQAVRQGVNQFFFADGSTVKSKYNGVNWRSFSANLGLIYEF